MTTVSIGMCKDELDVIESHLRHLATQVDHMIMADNNSSDGTRDILSDLAKDLPLTVFDDPEVGYYQANKMTCLARLAGRDFDAEFIVPADCDEIWFSPHGRIADVLAQYDDWHGVAVAPLWDHRTTDLDEPGSPVQAMRWREPQRTPLHKVACRWHESLAIQQGNHNVTYAGVPAFGSVPGVIEGAIHIRHFPYRSPEQFVRKVVNGSAAYRASNLPEDMGGHWRSYGRILDEHGPDVLIRDVYRKWFHRPDPTVDITVDGEVLPALIEDPAPCLLPH